MSLNRAIWTLNLRPHYPQASEEGKALVEQMRKQRVQLTPPPAAEPPQQNSARAENSDEAVHDA